MQRRAALVFLTALAMLATLALPAAADHTAPNEPVTLPIPEEGFEDTAPPITRGDGEWEFIRNFPSNVASDVTFFRKGDGLFASQGTLGQGPPRTTYVGQRMFQLMTGDTFDEGADLRFRADHGSAACEAPATSATGLQHDSFATPTDDAEIMVDSTDAVGRCHDAPGGGIELIDVSGIDDPLFEPREVHLMRFSSTTHTVTLDPARPWIVYANNSAFADNNWVDVVNIKSCLSRPAGGTLDAGADLGAKREHCRPSVHRVPFEDVWTQQTFDGEPPPEGNSASCHDTVVEDDIMYCSGLNAEVLLDLSGMFDANGDVKGDPLPCQVIEAAPGGGVTTGAMVTDCVLETQEDEEGEEESQKDAYQRLGSPRATGWDLIGFYNHPGRNDGKGGTTGNTNVEVPATEGVAVSHETRPIPQAASGDRKFIVVSDERGGGVVPGGANCTDDNFDVYNHGGLHFFDVTDPDNIEHATMVDVDGEEAKAVWRGDVVIPQPTFCVVHRFRHLPDEQRIIAAYYSQGVKILDYEIDGLGRFSFTEVASLQFEDSNTWTADVFHTEDDPETGERTYHIAMSDTLQATGNLFRGLDVVTWTAEPNPIPEVPVRRVSGKNRITTATAVSRSTYEQADTVVLARADEYADALAGAPLAAQLKAPVLLTNSNRLLPEVTAEIDRLGAKRVVLLGGTAALDEQVEKSLRDHGLAVDRVFGPNRFSTAAAIAQEMGGDFDSVFLTEGIHSDPARGWPDAMSAAPYAAFTSRPILLTGAETFPGETESAFADLSPDETVVVGGSGAVSDAIFERVRADGHGPRRLAGRNRFETSVAVYEEGLGAGMSTETLWLATGLNWPDSLTGGAAVGARGDAMLLVAGNDLDNSPAAREAIRDHRHTITTVNVLGGTAAISDKVLAQVDEVLNADDDSGAAAVPTGGTGSGIPPLTGEAALLLLALALLPIAAVVGRRRLRVAV